MTRWRKNHDSYCLKSVYFEAEHSLFNKLVQKLRKGELSVWVGWRLVLDITEGDNWSFDCSFLARDCTDSSFSSPVFFPSSFGLETRVSRIYVILAECQSSYSSFQALSLWNIYQFCFHQSKLQAYPTSGKRCKKSLLQNSDSLGNNSVFTVTV